MDVLCRSLILLCIGLGQIHARKLCRGKAECIPFDECKGLYAPLTEMTALRVRELAKILHCGFRADRKPLVCCPPVFTFVPQSRMGIPEPLRRRKKTLTLLPSECGLEYSNKIVNGQLTDIDEHPWLVLLRNEKSKLDGFFCGGALISSRYVLTAAHCINGPTLPTRWKVTHVRLGEWNTSSVIDCFDGLCNLPPLDVPVEESIVHEEYYRYDENQPNDIALLRMAYTVPYSDFVRPICLPLQSQKDTFEGWDLVVAGWGKTEKSEFSDVKLKVNMPVVVNQICDLIYKLTSKDINENQICAGGKESKDSCKGDSGGPLMGQVGGKWMALGVVSYGPAPCGSPEWPGVYTRVTSYVDWILDNLRP